MTAERGDDEVGPNEPVVASKADFDRLLRAGFIDTFRVFEPGGGHYTWWSNRKGVRQRNIGWRIDYHFVNEELLAKVKSAEIRPEVMGSDHCPVIIELKR